MNIAALSIGLRTIILCNSVMENQLDQLVRDFSKEENISQKEVFEGTLEEFLQKYGYKQELQRLLQQK